MSASIQQFVFASESNLELKASEATLHPASVPPTLRSVFAEIGPFPREALFLGVASDGLPVLLNLHDPAPGPLLVAGEAGAGKTGFLQSITRVLAQTHAPDQLQYGVVTNRPDEWGGIGNTKHRVGVFSFNHTNSRDFMLSLASWAHGNKNSKQSVLLLIDDLEAAAKLDFDALQSFRWLLARGPARRVWTVVTMNAERYGQVLSWIPIFHMRVFGRIRNERIAEVLSSDKTSALYKLEAPFQFSLRENEKWVKFWLASF